MPKSCLLACNNPTVLRRLFESIAVTNPDAVMSAGADIGIISDSVKIPSVLNFPLESIETKIFDAVAVQANAFRYVEAIKVLQASTGVALKHAKEFVDYYFPNSRFPSS